MSPTFFATPADFRRWLETHHENARELWVGFYKRATARPSLTSPESVDEALCFGWIDGLRRGIDERSYAIRFTPRRPASIWSAVNVRRAKELVKAGLMRAAGLRLFTERAKERSALYSREREAARLTPAEERRFRANRRAWEFFERKPPSYRKLTARWIASAKRAETRASRLAELIAESARGRTPGAVTPPGRSRRS